MFGIYFSHTQLFHVILISNWTEQLALGLLTSSDFLFLKTFKVYPVDGQLWCRDV